MGSDNESITKKCSKCREHLKKTVFGRCSRSGLQTYCKPCEKQYRLEKKEHYKALRKERKAVKKKYDKVYSSKLTPGQIADRKAYAKKYRKEMVGLINAKTARRRSLKLQATPKWLTQLDHDHIKMFYEAAADQKRYGLTVHVDHIIPLQGEDVCGLHIAANLQLLPASENLRKSNKYGQ